LTGVTIRVPAKTPICEGGGHATLSNLFYSHACSFWLKEGEKTIETVPSILDAVAIGLFYLLSNFLAIEVTQCNSGFKSRKYTATSTRWEVMRS
jgi:hypothetical protein